MTKTEKKLERIREIQLEISLLKRLNLQAKGKYGMQILTDIPEISVYVIEREVLRDIKLFLLRYTSNRISNLQHELSEMLE